MYANRRTHGYVMRAAPGRRATGRSESGLGGGLDGEGMDPLDAWELEDAPAHSFRACSARDRTLIADAVVRARAAVGRATKYVADAHGRPHKMSSVIRRLLLEHFHTTDRKHLRDILTRLMSIEKVFGKGIGLECEKQCNPQTSGFANATQLFGGWGPLHICFDPRPGHFDFAGASAEEQEALVIHEAAHRHLGIDDKAYVWETKYAKLTAKQALDNADSYAYFSVRSYAARPAILKESETELDAELEAGSDRAFDLVEAEYFDFERETPPFAPKADGSRPDLGLTAKQVTSYDWAFAGKAGTNFIALVRQVAGDVGLDPGLVAVNLIAEYYRDSYLGASKVSSFEVGTDDYYAKLRDIAAKVPAHAKVRIDKTAGVGKNTNEKGRVVQSITFLSGPDAALASAAYLKHGEVVLREEARRLGKDFDALSRETRYMLTRFAFNAGLGAGRAELAKALKGQDVLVRKAAKQAGPRRIATLRAAQAVRVGRKFFGAL